MTEFTPQEHEYLLALLKKRLIELMHELHHAVTHAYKDGIKHEIDLTEQLQKKLGTK